LSIQGAEVNNIPELQEQVGRYRPGDEVALLISRGGKTRELNLQLKNRNGDTRLIKYTESVANELGAEFTPLSEREKNAYKLNSGLKVENIREGRLRNIGIKEGFIITNIGEKQVNSISDITNALKSERKGLLIEGVYPNGAKAYYGLGI
jgi:serine protease Do